MSITRDEVAHLARLSRLALSDEELDHLAPQLDQIISAVAQVQEVAAEGIPPTSHATGITNVFRDDDDRSFHGLPVVTDVCQTVGGQREGNANNTEETRANLIPARKLFGRV